MQVDLGPELESFRSEMRAWIEENAPAGLAELTDWNSPATGGGPRRGLEAAQAHALYRQWEERLLGRPPGMSSMAGRGGWTRALGRRAGGLERGVPPAGCPGSTGEWASRWWARR